MGLEHKGPEQVSLASAEWQGQTVTRDADYSNFEVMKETALFFLCYFDLCL